MGFSIPSIVDVIAGLAKAQAKISAIAQQMRDKYGAVTDAPQEFLNVALPILTAAVGDPAYAESLALQAWTEIQSGHPSYNPHHGGGA